MRVTGTLPPSAGSHWAAHLELSFHQVAERTVLGHSRHVGPLRVQRPFYPEANGTCHVYLLHPPGGVVAGDRLTIEVRALGRSRALVTTPSATKLYRSDGRTSRVDQRLFVGDGGLLEWLPQESVAFNGACAHLSTHVSLHGAAVFAGWDILCLGRSASQEKFRDGRLVQSLEVWREGRPLLCERLELAGDGRILTAPWGLNGCPVVGCFVVAAPAQGLVAAARAGLDALPGAYDTVACSELEGGLVCRYVGSNAQRARALFGAAWSGVRECYGGGPASPPRIWAT